VGIGDEPVDGHGLGIPAGCVRLASTALVPVDEREHVFDRPGVAGVRRELRCAGPAVEEQHDRITRITGPDVDPLVSVTEAHPTQPDAIEPGPV